MSEAEKTLDIIIGMLVRHRMAERESVDLDQLAQALGTDLERIDAFIADMGRVAREGHGHIRSVVDPPADHIGIME